MTELMVDNTMISRAGENEKGGYYDCGSMTAVSRMDKDKHAWIRTTSFGSYLCIRSTYFASFYDFSIEFKNYSVS
jgi:hypothetical protein